MWKRQTEEKESTDRDSRKKDIDKDKKQTLWKKEKERKKNSQRIRKEKRLGQESMNNMSYWDF